MTDQVDAIVVGSGVIGLACARRLALAGLETIALEGANAVGTGISSRNSEVIYTGIYYWPGSLKARLAVAGRQSLYEYCESRGVAHRRIDNWIVPRRNDQFGDLEAIERRGRINGVSDLRFVGKAEIRRREPALNANIALGFPSTGIVVSLR